MARPTHPQGLSPRVRGNRAGRGPAFAARGSIPACAGEPGLPLCPLLTPGVYPRVCGGTRQNPFPPAIPPGLSPRVRGNRSGNPIKRGQLGSIPACAGEPMAMARGPVHSKVYPRVCGGTALTVPRPGRSTGLSPRVRGNPTTTGPKSGFMGSIPACAGEPRRLGLKASMPEVYPRVCGGTIFGPVMAPSAIGLSPRVRGNHPVGAVRLSPAPPRSIPACAGEPGVDDRGDAPPQVYPRVCGGTAPTN